MDKLFKDVEFAKAITEKVVTEIRINQRVLGLRELGKMAGVSASTLSRVISGKIPDLETFFRLCKWMKRSTNEFYNHTHDK